MKLHIARKKFENFLFQNFTQKLTSEGPNKKTSTLIFGLRYRHRQKFILRTIVDQFLF
jgi:hypothetical protein